jgi:MarR family transcriptional regulator, lower aerobic nicotinate degradation pathway regulator
MERSTRIPRPWAMPEQIADRESLVLNKLAGWVLATVDDVLAPEGLRVRHYMTMSALRTGERKGQQALADKLHIDKATMVGVVAELERREYVERVRNPADKRHYLLWITNSGRTWLADADARVTAAEDEMFSPLSAEERRTLLRLMNALFEPPAT